MPTYPHVTYTPRGKGHPMTVVVGSPTDIRTRRRSNVFDRGPEFDVDLTEAGAIGAEALLELGRAAIAEDPTLADWQPPADPEPEPEPDPPAPIAPPPAPPSPNDDNPTPSPNDDTPPPPEPAAEVPTPRNRDELAALTVTQLLALAARLDVAVRQKAPKSELLEALTPHLDN